MGKSMNMGSEISWNANVAYLQEVITQVNKTDEKLSEGNVGESIEAVRTLYDVGCTKFTKEDDKFVDGNIDKIVGGYINYIKNQQNDAIKKAQLIEINNNLHKLYRHIIRLSSQYGLIKLDPDSVDPVDEVKNDY